jgi:uncharacterized protein YcbX
MTVVATIRRLARYPVKSMRGEDLPSIALGLQGVPEDRRYAFVQAGSRGPFPWLTARELPAMLGFRPFFDEGQRPRLLVATPEGAHLDVDSDELRRDLETRSGRPLFLLRDYRGNYDVSNVSIISLGTIAHIAAESGTAPNQDRFRANFFVETDSGDPFAEEQWVGRILRLGEQARVAVTEPDQRCVMITLDPAGGAAAPEVLRAVAQGNGNRAGVYGVVLTPGLVCEGDRVTIEP